MNTYPKSSLSKRRVFMVAAVLLGASSTAAALDFDLGGRVQEHSTWFSGSGKKTGATNDFPNGANLRRADLFAKGSLGRDDLSFFTHIRLNTEVAASGSHIQRAYVQWKCDNMHVRVGQQYVPFGLQQSTSSSNLMFLERSAASDLLNPVTPFFGVNAGMATDMFAVNLSVVTRELGDQNVGGNSDKYAYMFRAHAAPMQGDEGTVHVGVDYRHRKLNTVTTAGVAVANNATLSSSMELRGRAAPTNVLTLNGSAVLDSMRTYALELAGAYNGLVVEGEFFNAKAKLVGTNPDQTIKTWYAQAGYVLTGEHRMYDQAAGVFKDPKPSSDMGAWEVAARYTSVDLSGNAGGTVDRTSAGKNKTWTLGVNWFVTDQLKAQANYSRSKFSFVTAGVADRKIGAFGLGLQYLF